MLKAKLLKIKIQKIIKNNIGGRDNMEEKIKEYVLKNYPKMFKNREIIVVEKEDVWQIFWKDGSPLFLSKNVLK